VCRLAFHQAVKGYLREKKGAKGTKVMKPKTIFLIGVLLVVIMVLAASATTVLAENDRPLPPNQHAPVCSQVPYFGGGVYELRCTDAGKDIMDVWVRTTLKYDLQWDEQNVTLKVFAIDEKPIYTYWTVRDKDGAVVSGRLP